MTDRDAESFDRALLGFAEVLKTLGLKINPHRTQTAYKAVAAMGGIARRDHLYWAGKFSFCSNHDDLVVYDRAFQAWFSGLSANHSEVKVFQQERPVMVPADGQNLTEAGEFNLMEKKSATAAELEILRTADLALLAPSARAQVEDWIARLRPVSKARRTRRFDDRSGSIVDRRKSVRLALKSGGELAEIIFRRHRFVPRRVLFLIDVSGSMKAYSSAYLRFAYATKKVRRSTEVFTIGTRLTRVTKSLSGANVQRAVNQALHEIPDWSGGTRLGTQVRAFIREYGSRSTARGAIVVIASDGWERGDVQLLGESVSHLSRLANRIIWVNPHLHRPGFAPLTAGMEIVLPHVDRLVSGHSYRSFEALCREIIG